MARVGNKLEPPLHIITDGGRWTGKREVTMLPMLILDDRIRSTAKTTKNHRAV